MTGDAGQIPPKRFIAGAVCPRCGAQDRIRVHSVAGETRRECVACDFADVLPSAQQAELPQGRLDAPRGRPADGARPLVFHPPRRRKPPAEGA